MIRAFPLAALLAAGVAAAAAPTPRDFAQGLYLDTQPGSSLNEVVLPAAVYQGVERPDLRDLRVFNEAGTVAPHALCSGPRVTPGEALEVALPVLPLSAAVRRPREADAADMSRYGIAGSGSSRIEVESAAGTRVRIEEDAVAPAAAGATPPRSGYVVDASHVAAALSMLRLKWSTADGASEVPVRVEASDDLDRWRVIVPHTMLFRAASDGTTLERMQVELPPSRYRYLRLERSDAGPQPAIDEVVAIVQRPAVVSPLERFAAEPVEASAGDFRYRSDRLAPVQRAEIALPVANMSLGLALESRAAPQQPWIRHWTGDASSASDAPTVAEFAATPDRDWRLRVLRGAESLTGAWPTLHLGYHPARLRFLAQGAGPFVLAFGSAQAPPAEQVPCDAWVTAGGDAARMVATATSRPAPAGLFGGDAARVVPPAPTPLRRYVLWGILIAGAGLLVALALSLKRQLQPPDGPKPGPSR